MVRQLFSLCFSGSCIRAVRLVRLSTPDLAQLSRAILIHNRQVRRPSITPTAIAATVTAKGHQGQAAVGKKEL
jgi:hypothetical protein